MGTAAYPGRRPVEPSPDRYELVEKLKEGGMGVVWRGRDRNMDGRKIAIKVMKDVSDASWLDMFEKEWKALAALSHPNIVDVLDAGMLSEGGQRKPFFVMPLLPGKTLADLIGESSERLRVSRVGKIITDVCTGLQAAHQAGLVHRDLKPSNIFVLDDDSVKIIDFGVVHVTGEHSVAGQKGTPQYMSPEQILVRDITASSDIFSLGVILYEALTGRNPFLRQTPEETREAVLRSNPQPVSELNPGIPHGVAQVVHHCLAKKPFNRFTSARELSEMLNRGLQNQTVFDTSKLRDRLERIREAMGTDLTYAAESLAALESEGHIAPEITALRNQIDAAMRQKRIDQLMSIARASIQHDEELDNALAKVAQVLEIDPENAEARALKVEGEKKRSEREAADWIKIGYTHVENRDFSDARKAASEALEHHPTDSRALELMRKIDEVESVAQRVRAQKAQYYEKALRDFQNGEVESAKSRLDRLLSEVRLHPEGAVPELDAVYESFYNEVCGACDSLRSQYEEAQKLLEAENFAQARAVCAELLLKYPKNDDLHTLKFQIEVSERQKISADFAAATRDAEAEPDLNRRANIWQEAVKAHAGEARFGDQYKLACDRRDLVNSIVKRAQDYGESGQYADALNQWERLRKLHPSYPGLGFEIDQGRKKRDLQAKEEEKTQAADEIVSLMKVRDFQRALERIEAAKIEFSGDAVFTSLEAITQDTWARVQESNRLLAEGQAAEGANDSTLAIELLKRALELDAQNSVAQDALIRVLTDEARNRLDSDLVGAERLYLDAKTISANHHQVRSLGSEITDARRRRDVSECLTAARGLDAVGNITAAFDGIREGRKLHPKDPQLQSFYDYLLRTNPELRVREDVIARQEQLKAAQERLERNPDLAHAKEVHDLARELGGKDPNGAESLKKIAEAEVSIRKSLSPDDFNTLWSLNTEFNKEKPAKGQEDATVLYKPTPPKPSSLILKWWTQVRVKSAEGWQKATALIRAMDLKTRRIVFASAGTVTIAVAGYLIYHHFKTQGGDQTTHVPPTSVHLVLTPPDSSVKFTGQPHSVDFQVPVGQTQPVEVSHPGYQTQTVTIGDKRGDIHVILPPLPLRLSTTTSLNGGYLELDGTDAGAMPDGSLDLDVPSDGQAHRIAVVVGAQRFMEMEFQANPGEIPKLTPIGNGAGIRDMLIVAGFGATATIYAGDQLKKAQFGGHALNLGTSGTDVAITDQNNTLAFKYHGQSGTQTLSASDRPSLFVRSLSAGAQILITCNVDGATLTANGKPVQKRGHGWRITQPDSYTFVLSAKNYQTQTWTRVLDPMQSISDLRELVPISPKMLLSALTISNATPGARVDVDEVPKGNVGADGTLQIAGVLSSGNHQVRFSGDCGSRNIDVGAAPPGEVHISEARLNPCASITLLPTSPEVTVKIHPAEESGGSGTLLSVGQKRVIQAGNYNVVVEAPSEFRSYQTGIKLDPAQNLDFTPILEKLTKCQLSNLQDVTAVDVDWNKSKNPSAYVHLRPGCVNVNLSFLKPNAAAMHKERVEWELVVSGGKAQIEWTLENGKIHRKVTVDQHSFDSREANVHAQMNPGANRYDIQIRVDGQHIRVQTGNNVALDDYLVQSPELHDLGAGTIGVRTSTEYRWGEP